MSNPNSPTGFQQYYGTGATPTYETAIMSIASAYGTAIFSGDPVVQINTGYIQQAANSGASGNTAIAGIFVGCHYMSVAYKRRVWMPYWPGSDASGDVEAQVIIDPNTQFIVQTANSNTTATAVGLSAIGQNIGFNLGAGGNTATGLSGAYADQFRLVTDASAPFRVVALANYTPGQTSPLASIGGNDATSAYNRIIVAFNNAGLKSLTGI